jgi:hypothetical protein
MKIIIEFDEVLNSFNVQFDRGEITASAGEDPAPPPPYNEQIQEMTAWLNKTYPSILAKFKDREISGLRMNCSVTPKK